MTESIQFTDATLNAALNDTKPMLLLISNGDGLRSDFKTEWKKQLGEANGDIVFGEVNPKENPETASRFNVKEKPVMVAWAGGESLVRRVRPWGTDIPLAIDMLNDHLKAAAANVVAEIENQADDEAAPNKETLPMNNVIDTPVTVTDATFQTEVVESELPVIVDYWAPWCGPCRMVAPILDTLAKEFAGQIKIAKVNVDENPGLSGTFQIRSIPTLMAIKNRTIVFNQPGALPEPTLRDIVNQLMALEVPDPEEQEHDHEHDHDHDHDHNHDH